MVGTTLKINVIVPYQFLQQITLYNFSRFHLNDPYISYLLEYKINIQIR
jgi:hypothetical protein